MQLKGVVPRCRNCISSRLSACARFFLSLSHLLPLLFTPCCFESVYECDSLCFSDYLCHRILDIALFVLHFDLFYDRCHSLRKYVNFHLISVQVLGIHVFPQTLCDTHNPTHSHAYPLYINHAHLLTDGYSSRYSFNAQI